MPWTGRHLPLLDDAATATGSTKGRADALLSMRDVCRFLAADPTPKPKPNPNPKPKPNPDLDPNPSH